MLTFLYILPIMFFNGFKRLKRKVISLENQSVQGNSTEATRNRILKLLDSRGKSQRQFASDLGISPSLVSRWLTGSNSSFTYQKWLTKIADYFNVSVEYLIGPSGNHTENDSEAEEYLIELKNRPELRTLFKVTKSATKKDIERAVEIIKVLKKNSDQN